MVEVRVRYDRKAPHLSAKVYLDKFSEAATILHLIDLLQLTNKTGDPIGAWKCNLPTFFGNYGDRQTDRPMTDQPINKRTCGLIGKFSFQ